MDVVVFIWPGLGRLLAAFSGMTACGQTILHPHPQVPVGVALLDAGHEGGAQGPWLYRRRISVNAAHHNFSFKEEGT